MALKSYLQQLEQLASAKKVPLHQAFKQAGVAETTLSRARRGLYELRHDTARKVHDVLVGERVLSAGG